jgi:hypothetical protein
MKRRFHLNILVEHNPTSFISHVAELVDQLEDVDHISLFLSGIGYVISCQICVIFTSDHIRKASRSQEEIASLCDLLL